MNSAAALSRISTRKNVKLCLLPTPPVRSSLYTSGIVHAILFFAIPYLGLVIPLPPAVRYQTSSQVIDEMKEEPLITPSLPNVTSTDRPDSSAGAPSVGESGNARAVLAKSGQSSSQSAAAKVLYPGAQFIVSDSPNATNRIQTVRRPDVFNPPKLKFPLPLQPMVALSAASVRVEKSTPRETPAPPKPPEIAVRAPELIENPTLAVQVAQLKEVEVARFVPPPADQPRTAAEEPKPPVEGVGKERKSVIVVNAVRVPHAQEMPVPDAEINGSFVVGPRESASANGGPIKVAEPAIGRDQSGASATPIGSTTGPSIVTGEGRNGPDSKLPGQGPGSAETGSTVGPGTGKVSSVGGSRGAGKLTGSGSGSGAKGAVVPGLTITGGSTGRGGQPGRQPQPRQGYGITIISGGSSGGATRDLGYFAPQDTVYTVFIPMNDAGGGPDWSMQYCTASQVGAGLLVPPIADHKAGMSFSPVPNSAVTVQIGAIIDESGGTTNIRAVRGSEAMTAAAMKALQEWHFEPAQINGKPVSVKILMGIPVR